MIQLPDFKAVTDNNKTSIVIKVVRIQVQEELAAIIVGNHNLSSFWLLMIVLLSGFNLKNSKKRDKS